MRQWVKSGIGNAKGYFIRPRKIALVYALSIFVGLLVIWQYIGGVVEDRLLEEERLQVANRVNNIGNSLTLAVSQRLTITTSVHSYLVTKIMREDDFSIIDPDENVELDGFISVMFNSISGIRNIAIAPGGVMAYVYPYEDNKSVLGYKPTVDERLHVREEVRRAIQSGEIVLSLPYELIQGGQGLIARQAVKVDGHYWGLANIVVDLPPLLEEAGIIPMPAGLELALKDQSGMVFVGDQDVFAVEPVIYEVELPEGKWSLAAAPDAGWGMNYRALMRLYNGLGLVAIAAISVVVYLFTNRRKRLLDLVDRRTQELTQSNQTLINVLEGIDADVYVADLDSYEILFANKHIKESFNDNLIGKVCYEVFRNESKLCTHCLNEKLLDSNGKSTGVHVWEICNPVTNRWYKNADRAIRWHDGRYVHLQIATDITDQKQAVDAIRESETRYRKLFNSVPVGIYRSTPEGRFLDGNRALLEILGYPNHETMLASNIKDLYVSKGDREQELVLVEQNDSVSNYRLKLRRYNGDIIWVQDSSNVVRDDSGETLYYYGRLEDITERVKAEATISKAEGDLKALVQEKDILLAEVHHRVKNNMQVIVSLLGLQANEIEDERLRAVYEESRSRIKSMSLVHEQLYLSKEYASIEFEPYIDQLAITLFNTYQIEPDRILLSIAANDVFIDLERAIPCGLLLNELITNSLKYAFPNDRKGHIWIEIKSEANQMILSFGDDGIGLPKELYFGETQSLGLQLVRMLVNHDLRGSVDIGNGHRNGTHFLIKFPWAGMKSKSINQEMVVKL